MGIGSSSRPMLVAVALTLAPAAVAATTSAAGSSTTPTTSTTPTAPSAPATSTTVPPDTSFLRAQAEQAFAATFPDATGVACAPPPADDVGVEFPCYGRSADGAVVAQIATVNDDGGIDFSEAATAGEPTTAPPTTLPPPVTGSGNGQAAVGPLNGPAIVAVTHRGSGAFTLQPQQGGVATGAPLVDTTGVVEGRFLAGLDGTVDSFGVTAGGDWSVQVQPASSALALTAEAPAAGSGPDVVRFGTNEPAEITVAYDGDGAFAVSAVTGAGSVALTSHTGPYRAPLTLPAGPGFLVVGGVGAWSVSLGAPATLDTAVG